MKQLGLGALLLWAPAPEMSAQPKSATGPAPGALPASAASAAHQTFTKYCVECHGADQPKAGLSIAALTEQMSETAVGEQADAWLGIARMLETRQMPPDDADRFPSDAERAAAAAWIRTSLDAYEAAHAGEPGRVTVRRLTSAEYAYAIRDLTGVDVKVGIDASSDSVGGEGFANFGDVQFVQDATVERYLEAAKQVADHAVIGSGPLGFYTDPGKTGLELSALNRIQRALRGARASASCRARADGRSASIATPRRSTSPGTTSTARRSAIRRRRLRGLAAQEGITGRFAEHIWDAVNRDRHGLPEPADDRALAGAPGADADVPASVARARAECDALVKELVTWPSWFFARGDLAAGGAGDESPLVFDDTTLAAVPTHAYAYRLNRRFAGRAGGLERRPGPLDGAPVGRRAPQGPRRHSRGHLAQPARRAAHGGPAAGARRAGRRHASPRMPGPILKTHAAARRAARPTTSRDSRFGTSPDGTPSRPRRLRHHGGDSFVIDVPATSTTLAELHADVGARRRPRGGDPRDVADRPDGPRASPASGCSSATRRAPATARFRAGIAEYVALMPPNSHGEPNPADKDPVPAPFDNTYNSPEHDAFVTKVKYQRTDDFFTRNIVDGEDRARPRAAPGTTCSGRGRTTTPTWACCSTTTA